MDYETLDTILKSPETLYAGLVAGGIIAGSVLGYISGRSNSKARERNAEFQKLVQDVELAKQQTKKQNMNFKGKMH